ncbi:phosphocarrier protein [Anaerovirgula multivorans]|uniref:Phosphocarrier protein HPr n=1 Tax=Anaerovirgula multivorans TaxID=312168 RepID=A0A239G8E4_9FIRM|nr:HPr family phosphocarrier protein [Anaerovirgula multivorans]SNS64723.1 phosphocarrier protein [Anaerovirgula multivorans]
MERKVMIQNETGLHARPASSFVKVASQFTSDINIEFNGKLINGKSILNILSAGLQKGAEIKIIATGADEKEAVEALENLINSKFNE